MNSRRGFFKTLVAGALAAVLPKPKLHGFGYTPMPPFDYTAEFTRALRHYHELLRNDAKDYYAFYSGDKWEPHTRIGDTITIKMPERLRRTIDIVNPDGSVKRVAINAPTSGPELG